MIQSTVTQLRNKPSIDKKKFLLNQPSIFQPLLNSLTRWQAGLIAIYFHFIQVILNTTEIQRSPGGGSQARNPLFVFIAVPAQYGATCLCFVLGSA